MRAIRFTLPVIAVFFVCAPLAAQLKDNFGDPLPDSASVRIGTTRMYKSGGGFDWYGAVLTPDGKFLLSVTSAGVIERLDIATGLAVGTIGEKDSTRHGGDRISISADGKRVMLIGVDTVTVLDMQTGRELTRVVPPVTLNLPSVASLSADGATLAFGINNSLRDSAKQEAVVWVVGEQKRRLTIETPQDRRVAVSLSPDGKILATWGNLLNPDRPGPLDVPIQFWDTTNGKKLGEITVTQVDLREVAFSPDGKSAAVIDGNGDALLIDPKTGRESKRFTVRGAISGRVFFSLDGKTIAVALANGTVALWDVAAEKELSVTKFPVPVGSPGATVVFTGAKQAVAWCTVESKAVVWEVPSGKVLSPAASPWFAPNSLAFTADGKELLAGINSNTWEVWKWDPVNGKAKGVVKFEVPKGINLPSYGRKATLLSSTKALASAQGLQYVYNLRTGKMLHDLQSIRQDYKITKVDWAADVQIRGSMFTRQLRTSDISADGEIMIVPLDEDEWKSCKAIVCELVTKKKLCEIELSAGRIDSAVRTSDGKNLITANYYVRYGNFKAEITVTLRDLKTGKKLREITETEPMGGWATLAPHPDGTGAYFTDSRNGLRFFNFTTGKVSTPFNTGGLTPCAGPILSPDGKLFAVGLCDVPHVPKHNVFDVRVYDVATGKPLKTFRGHKGLVTTLAFSPDSKTLASGSFDTTVLLWDLTK